MLPDRYRVIQHGSLDDLYRAVERCKSIIKTHEEYPKHPTYGGYARVARQWIPAFEEEITSRRSKGEVTIVEELQKITGNSFVVLQSI